MPELGGCRNGDQEIWGAITKKKEKFQCGSLGKALCTVIYLGLRAP